MDRNRIEENFLTAMQTIAKAEVAAVKYDQTITCTIVDDSLRESGQYMVSDGTTRFPAYSSITSLRKDTVVYVTVPNGDFTQQKIIVGRQMEGEDKSFLYTAPFDNFIRCTPNLLTLDESTNKGNGYRLYANGSLIGDINNIDDICEEIKDKDGNSTGTKLKTTYSVVTERKDLVNYYKDFTRLGIRANFISWLKEYDITSGDYGLSFTISYQDGELEDTTNLSGQNNVNGQFDIYKREETGFDINKEYYEKDSNGYKIVANITKDSYKPNHYYYKNYVLDQDKSPRIRVQKDPSLNNSEDIYYTYYKKDSVIDQNTNTFIKYEFNKIDISEEKYEPGKYYYIPEEGLNEELQYKLSIDNGFIPNCQYFVMINNIFEPILITSETYDPKKNLYGVKPLLKTKYKTLLLDTSQMLGNKYGFDNYYSQEMVFDISGLGTITEILLTFYENGHFISGQKDKTIGRDNNTDIEKSLIKEGVSESLFSSSVYNPGYETLVVNNIEVYMGYETQVIGEDSDGYLKLFCYESDKYKATSNPLLNMKNIYLKWAYKNEDGKIYIADKDNVGTFIEYLKDGISDFPEGENNTEEKLAYFERFALDASPTQVENRNYYERFVSDKKPTASGAVGNVYLKADYNFIPNQGNPYNSGRDYFEYGVFTSNDGVINAEGLVKSVQKVPEKGEVVEQGIQYLKQTSTGDYLYEYPAVGTTISGSEWYKYDYASPSDQKTPTHYRGYKKVNIGANISQAKLYNYYYATYTNLTIVDQSDNNETSTANCIYIYYLKADMNVMEYKPEYYYYYNCPNDLFEVRWYRYAQGKPAADEYSGIYWERIPTTNELENSNMITHIVDDFQCELHPDYIYNEKEQIKAVILLILGETQKVFYSEPIEFFNESPTIDLPSLEVETALAPKFDDGSLGNYYLYGENNSLIDMGDSQTQRSISLLFDVAGGASETRSLLKDADKVTWIFPLENTAIVPSLSLMQGIYTEKDGLGYFEDTEKRQEYKFYYTIEKYYSYTDGDNAIVCNVIKDGILYSTTANMSFGQSGSNGSEYTLVLDLMTADGMITLNPTNNLYYKGLVSYQSQYGKKEKSSDTIVYPYPIKDKEPEGFYLKEELYVKPEEYKKNQIYYEYNSEKGIYSKTENTVNKDNYINYYIVQWRTFKQINIDDYDWLSIGYDNLYVVREFEDNERNEENGYKSNRDMYPCLDEYLYQYGNSEDKAKVNISTNPRNEEIKIVASLYDQSHKRINIDDYMISWKWEVSPSSPSGINVFSSLPDTGLKQSELILTCAENKSLSDISIRKDMYIISATLTGLTGYDLQSYLCLPLRYDFGPVKYQGPTEILHNSLGVPLFYKDEMNLYYNNKEGQLSRYPYMSFELYNADATNGLGPKLNKLSSDVAEDIFISYDLSDTEQLAENIQYFQNPEIKDIDSVEKSTKDKSKAWSGYFTPIEKINEQNEKLQYYEKITDNENIIQKDIAVYDFTNLYSITLKENESNDLYYNNYKFSKDNNTKSFKIGEFIEGKSDTLVLVKENTLKEKILKKYATKYYLYEYKNKYQETSTYNKLDQAYQLVGSEIYENISQTDYNNAISKPVLYTTSEYLPITYEENVYEDTPLFDMNQSFDLYTNDLIENEIYYTPVEYNENVNGTYYKWYEKKSKSEIVFKNNTYYTLINNIFTLIESLEAFNKLKEDYCYVFFGYKQQDWSNPDECQKDTNEKYEPNFSHYIIIENQTKKQESLNYFVKNVKYELNEEQKTVGKVYYMPSKYEKIDDNPSYVVNWKNNNYFIQKTKDTYFAPIPKEEISTTQNFYYRKKGLTKDKNDIDITQHNFIAELRLTDATSELYKNTSVSIAESDIKNYFILDFSACSPLKSHQAFKEDYCFIKTENKILNKKSSDSEAKGEGCFLQVPSIYINGLEQFAIQLKYNDNTIFSIPVLYYLNRYFSSTINKWDGELTISGEKNTILAKMIGAGKKDKDNKFTGVIMGDWSNNNNSNLETGIYGFHDGATSFGFSANGQGFIGKAGHGRIIFDGNNAQLRSAAYAGGWNAIDEASSYQSSGLLIDLDDAFLLATASDATRYIKIDAKTTGAYKNSETGPIIYPEPSNHPKPNRTNQDTQQYPFVIYGGPNLYTEIGWNGDLKLKGSAGSAGEGQISLDASGEIPFEIKSAKKTYNASTGVDGIENRYVQINWDASIILSGVGWDRKILLDASAPYFKSLPEQYHLNGATSDWESAKTDRPFQIGQYLRATWDGYLEAQGAFFKNSNANSFNIHYDNGVRKSTEESSISGDNFFIGRQIAGTIGFLDGFNGQGATQNLGITSKENHGIKLNSLTNLSITAKPKPAKIEDNTIAKLSRQTQSIKPQYINITEYVNGITTYYKKDSGSGIYEQFIAENQTDFKEEIKKFYTNNQNVTFYYENNISYYKEEAISENNKFDTKLIYCYSIGKNNKLIRLPQMYYQNSISIGNLSNLKIALASKNTIDLSSITIWSNKQPADNNEDDNNNNEDSNNSNSTLSPIVPSSGEYVYEKAEEWKSDITAYFYQKKDNTNDYIQVWCINEEGQNDHYIDSNYKFSNRVKEDSSLENYNVDTVYYRTASGQETTNVDNSNTSDQGITSNWEATTGPVGGIYMDAQNKIHFSVGEEKNSSLTILSPNTISNFITNKFEILDYHQDKDIVATDNSNSYANLLSITTDIVSENESNIRKSQLKTKTTDTILQTEVFIIQTQKGDDETAGVKSLFDINKTSITNINTKKTIFTEINNNLSTLGYIDIAGMSDSGYGLKVTNKTMLLGSVGIGTLNTTSNKLYVNGSSCMNGNLTVSGTTTTTNLTATGTIKLRTDDGFGTNPTITVSSSGITFTGGAANQSGIYARFA